MFRACGTTVTILGDAIIVRIVETVGELTGPGEFGAETVMQFGEKLAPSVF
jgi:hypothetical protein